MNVRRQALLDSCACIFTYSNPIPSRTAKVLEFRPFLSPGGGGGYSDIYTYVGSGHFWGSNFFEFQYFWGFSENEYLFGYEDFVDIFGGHFKIGQ